MKKRKWNAMQIMVPGFLGMIFLGAFLLMLPVCNRDGGWLNFTDALFTSCTCVCVTGLVTVVPALQFSAFGQVIMLLLIQFGGWGVIICAMYFLVLIRRRLSVSDRLLLKSQFSTDSMGGLVRMLKFVIRGTLIAEGLGAAGFMVRFIPKYGIGKGIWFGIFHAVSAFCNAGVDLLGDSSLAVYVSDPWMNFVTVMLIVSGGLGFFVWQDLGRTGKKILGRKTPLRRALRETELQTKIVVVLTGALLLFGMLFVLAAEYDNPLTLGSLSFPEKLGAAFFQSVTTRTAGFYTVSQSGLRNATRFFCCILMFIGGSPGGTAGGSKTVTAAVLAITCWSIMKGHLDTECFRRRISDEIVRMSVLVIFVCLLFDLAGITALSAVSPDAPLINVMYEVVSATATVGLTADLTPSLSLAGKIIIMILMYLGRIGPITLPTMIAEKIGSKGNAVRLKEEHIVVG